MGNYFFLQGTAGRRGPCAGPAQGVDSGRGRLRVADRSEGGPNIRRESSMSQRKHRGQHKCREIRWKGKGYNIVFPCAYRAVF